MATQYDDAANADREDDVLALVSAVSAVVTTPRPRCDDQGYVGLGQPLPESPALAPRSILERVVTSIDRVSVNGTAIADIYNLKDGHRYFSRRISMPLTPQRADALTTFLSRDTLLKLSSHDLQELLTAEVPTFIPIRSSSAAARLAGLSITHCL